MLLSCTDTRQRYLYITFKTFRFLRKYKYKSSVISSRFWMSPPACRTVKLLNANTAVFGKLLNLFSGDTFPDLTCAPQPRVILPGWYCGAWRLGLAAFLASSIGGSGTGWPWRCSVHFPSQTQYRWSAEICDVWLPAAGIRPFPSSVPCRKVAFHENGFLHSHFTPFLQQHLF